MEWLTGRHREILWPLLISALSPCHCMQPIRDTSCPHRTGVTSLLCLAQSHHIPSPSLSYRIAKQTVSIALSLWCPPAYLWVPQLPTLHMWAWLMLLGFPEARELGRGDQVAPCIVAAFSRVPVHPSTVVLWGVATGAHPAKVISFL